MESPIKLLEQLYGEMGPDLLAYFRRQRGLAGGAEDLLQDTFVCALRRIDRLRASVSPRAYLFGIARHQCLDALRRLRPTSDQPVDEIVAASAGTDARVEAMRTAITELPAVHREALLLKLQHELSYEEIAEVLNVPLGTVRSRLHHAVRQLKQRLNPTMSPPNKNSHES